MGGIQVDSASRTRRKLSGKTQHEWRGRQQNQTISSHHLCHSGEEILGNISCWHLWVKNLSKQGEFVFKREVHILNSALQRMGLFQQLLTELTSLFHITPSFPPNYPPPAENVWVSKDKMKTVSQQIQLIPATHSRQVKLRLTVICSLSFQLFSIDFLQMVCLICLK